MSTLFDALTCPLDGLPLRLEGTSWRCDASHSFDVASQGYVNLLPVQNKRSLQPGDSKEMVAARKAFLEEGYFEPIAKELQRIIFEHATAPCACLDAGCGEGYYVRYLASCTPFPCTFVGLDISKWAVRAAAVQSKNIRWLVASNAQLPLAHGCFDWVLSLFGFPVFESFAKVLKPQGSVLVVNALAGHLSELKAVIYPSIKEKHLGNRELPQGFTLARTHTLNYKVMLPTQEAIATLLAMTPHQYRAPAWGLERAKALKELEVTVEVEFSRYVLKSTLL